MTYAREISLIRRFGQWNVQYWSVDGLHCINVSRVRKKLEIHSSSFVQYDLPVTFETVDGRRFVGQAYTDRLPRVFEIKYPDDERLEQLDETD